MKAVFAISILSPLALFGAFADKDWAKRTFAPTNAASVAEAAAVTNAQQDARILALEGVSRSKIEAGSGQSLNRISADRTVVGDGVQLGRLALESSVSSKQDALSPAQTNAVDSGVTAQKVSSYDSHVAAFSRHVTSADKLRWDAKQDAIPDYTTTAAVHSIVSSDVASWATAGNPRPSGTVSDVKVNGTSVIAGGIANVSVPVTDVRTGGVSIVSNGIADFTIPDVVLPETWPWESVSGRPTAWAWANLTGIPSWITDSSPIPTTMAWGSVTGKPSWITDASPIPSVWPWSSVSGKPGIVYTSALNILNRSNFFLFDEGFEVNHRNVMSYSSSLGLWEFQSAFSEYAGTLHGRSLVTRGSATYLPQIWISSGRWKLRDSASSEARNVATEEWVDLNYLDADYATYLNSQFALKADKTQLPTKVSDLRIDDVTTNVIREVTGTFWDPGLAVTWRMFCSNGCFYVSAITNVNVTGVTP